MIQYRLTLRMYDTRSADSLTPIYDEFAELNVPTLCSIADRAAFDFLAVILRDRLVPEGSTVHELRAMEGVESSAPVPIAAEITN